LAVLLVLISAELVDVWAGQTPEPVSTTQPLKRLRERGYAQVKGGRLYFEEYGQGQAVVFLHAGLADSRMWDEQVNAFSGQYTVVRFDMRGYGQSDPPTAHYAPADDLIALLKLLKIDRACIVGLSVGATIGIDVAAAQPTIVSGLVSVAGSPGWMPYSDTLNQRTIDHLTAGKERGTTALVDGWLNDPMLAALKTQPKVEARVREFLTANAAGLMSSALMDPPDITAPRLSDFKMPTLIMVGDRDDPEIVERSKGMSREIPGAVLTVVPGVGHMVNLEAPRAFDEALGRFLRTLR
jgi:pimeloyl-ACP methyl ester carboxylesterase